MKLIHTRPIPESELLERLQKTRLRGFDRYPVYAQASLEIVPDVDPDRIVPAQFYVLKPNIGAVRQLRDAFLEEGIDLFALRGGYEFQTDEMESPKPFIPPVVEESVEAGGRTIWLLNDGMHRVYAARELGLPIHIVLVRNVPAEYPYYAYPLTGGWGEVTVAEDVNDIPRKKVYRYPDRYKEYFRDFNAVLPGIQEGRPVTQPARSGDSSGPRLAVR